ncbi:FAD-binding oxidoreductase [Salinibacterium sp. G-O1]|uniref:FAD-binding oxidoreductase n=1 Tax=Salinibacterium sp. G-O1 TaxID=3046208 RepID=UPI0024B979E1|nr:FAD-binding oxidoreductase [Salinibacterium sp. G-O1]MDJ0334365.1 FAD-binding oxidoreductase [Salinibacterium sp. G-O1]
MGTPETVVSELTPNFAGRIITAVDEDYDQARAIFNAMIDRHPAVIAQCASVKDVVAAIQAARNAGMEISVRGGGHGVAGAALVDDGLVIDLRLLNSATVDAKMSTVTVGGGATMSDLDQAGKPFGLATTGGRVSSTGVGGLVFGGGGGWLDRAFGLACDNLVSADLVTASGERVHASNEENTELFWALHGGGGNFGVVTSLTMRLHPLPSATLAMLFWDPAEGPAVGRAFRDFMMTAPNAIGGGADVPHRTR